VRLSHRNLVANLCQLLPIHRFGEGSRLVGVLPFFHIYGQTVIMNLALRSGATVVTMPRFELEDFLGLIERHRAARVHVAPPMVLALARHPLVARYDLSSLAQVFSGAAPLGADLERACSARLGCPVVQGYGLTETSPVTHVTPDDDGAARGGSVGPPAPGTECRIVDPERAADLGPGDTGEVWIRGPQVMGGYLNDPEATAQTLGEDGWLRTGDLAYADGDGYLYIVDRLKELIKYKGYQVPPAQLEALLLEHPAVADAAVVPMPDAEAGELPKAFIVAATKATADELIEFVAARVAPYKRIRLVEFIDEIPKAPSGKILRRKLTERDSG
jgi:acyl-CoA synthetase (AMP-forming)/AMP-acid ligase II